MARPEPPGGTVTFLLTDIAGSTRPIEELGEHGDVAATEQPVRA
jgi:hypothetical protein